MLSALIHAHTLSFLSSFPQPNPRLCRPSMASSSLVRIAVVGDVHDDWDLGEDTKALQLMKPDLVLFTGDFGNENVELVQNVAALNFPKAVILGNHDSWSTQQFSSKKKDRVQLQLEWYGVQDMDGSAKRIYDAALGTPEDHLVILLAHNGPTGLGSELNDICGKDWVFGGGDHGDLDLAQAISHLKETTTFSIPLVVFGHMHKELAYGNGLRKMIVVGTDDIIYLNGAIVPRVKRPINEQTAYRCSVDTETSLQASNSNGTKRAFTLVEILNGHVDKISESWVSVVGNETTLEEEYILFKSNGQSSL
ncbi:uncharacterized protein LOC111286307 isoform X2 [Durio zibethinus]|uniref:Uncharacterized protein LOC111286307 isoform X2 n=1 Tax=Durio zibethinus TaxID=66656 RepID=A0A6P5XUQ5_DURZI|nr:uncharacterized protein LOC111286307 isoform X2 [Durio zibethinus]